MKFDRLSAAFTSLVVASALAIGILSYGLITTVNNVEDLTKRVAMLNQVDCVQMNKARKANNRQVRLPLKRTLNTIGELLRRSAQNVKDPAALRELDELASQFERDAGAVTIVKPLTCEFVPADKN